jgi:hypothetical protein
MHNIRTIQQQQPWEGTALEVHELVQLQAARLQRHRVLHKLGFEADRVLGGDEGVHLGDM